MKIRRKYDETIKRGRKVSFFQRSKRKENIRKRQKQRIRTKK